jgi:hypothetical protein
METPLDLTKDMAILDEAIADCGEPVTDRGKAQLVILKNRLSLMKGGTGFTRGFSFVNQHEIDEFLEI